MTITAREFINLIFEALGQPAKLSAMGKLMMRLGGIFIPAAREII